MNSLRAPDVRARRVRELGRRSPDAIRPDTIRSIANASTDRLMRRRGAVRERTGGGFPEEGTIECSIDGKTGHVVHGGRVEDRVDALLDVNRGEPVRRAVVANAARFPMARFIEERMIGALAELHESGWDAPSRHPTRSWA